MKPSLYILLTLVLLPAACGPTPTPILATPTIESKPTPEIHTDSSQPVEVRIDDLIARMTLAEKIGQMTQVEKGSLHAGDITKYFIGSILSGGAGSPIENVPEKWAEMVASFQKEALATRLGVPLIYGVDAVHGHNNLKNATIFPHNIGLGAANDPALMEKIGRATAEEMLATGIPWDFAPMIAVPQDIRWGRTYESYSENTQIVTVLGLAFLKGMQSLPVNYTAAPGQTLFALATAKHFVGDGGTTWGTSTTNNHKIDQGDTQVDEASLRKLFIPPYKALVDAGALSIMASFSSWNGIKMHAQKALLTDLLKNELGFEGFIVSDWQAIDQIDPGNYYNSVVTAINAGVDMNMVPYDYDSFINTMKLAVSKGDIQQERLDDAVRRILRAKFALGLFDHPMPETAAYQSTLRSAEHLGLARQAVQKSLVLLKNDNKALPIAKDTPIIFVAGDGADNIGMQSGGWTITWQGDTGAITAGTSILEAVRATVGKDTQLFFDQYGLFKDANDASGKPIKAPVGIVVIGEKPYAEGVGDTGDLSLSSTDIKAIEHTREHVDKLIVVILSGRPLVIHAQYPLAEAWVAAWLPGSEGAGVTDNLFGDAPFTGKLPYSWPRSNEQLPININNAAGKTGCDAPMFPIGFGLAIGDSSPEIPQCK